VDGGALTSGISTTRTVILSPFDRLVFERDRLGRLWDFDYALEMYKPASARRWGYFALPVLHGTDLIGKVDAAADPASGLFRVHAVHEDGRWTRATRGSVDAAIEELADRLGLDVVRV
jgi:uncharacterized protein YcaQ